MLKSSLLAVAFARGMFGRAVALSVVTAMLVGCPDPQAQERQEVSRQFESALATYREAEIGFDPSSNDGADLDQVRYEKMQKAASALEAIRSKGSDAQKVATLRLLADIYEFSARYEQALALRQWSHVSGRDTVLLGYFGVADAAQSRVEANRADLATLLSKLQGDQRSAEQTIATLSKQASDLSANIAGLQNRIASMTAERDGLSGESLKLRQAAFVASGDEQFELNEQSAAKQREADALDAQIQQLQVQVDGHNAEAAVLKQQIALEQERLDAIVNQIASMNRRQSDSLRTIETVQIEGEEAQRQVLREIEQMTSDYTTKVAATFDSAAEKATKAVEAVAQAGSFARGDAQRGEAIRVEQARKQLTLMGILADRAVVQTKFGRTLAVVEAHAPRVMPDHVQTIAASFKQIQDQTATVTDNAQRAASEGLEVLGNISTEEVRESLQSLMTNYRARVEEAKVEAVKVSHTAAPSASPTAPITRTPSPSAGTTTSPTGTTTSPAAAVTGAMPALPDAVMSEQIAAFIVIDATTFNPQALQTSIKAIAGEQTAQMLAEPLSGFNDTYAAMTSTGGKGLIIAYPAPQTPDDEPEAIVFIGSDQPLDANRVHASFRDAAPEAPATDVTRVGQWLAIHPQGTAVPSAGNTAHQQRVKQALTAAGRKPITLVLAPSDEAKQLLAAFAPTEDAEDSDDMSQLMEESLQWLAAGVGLGDTPRIDVTVKLAAAADAQKLKTMIEASLRPASPQPGDMMAMLLAQAANAVTTRQSGDSVEIAVDAVKLRPLVQTAVMMLTMMGGDGGGAPADEGGFDFFK